MILLALAACLLGGVPVAGDCGAAYAYARYVVAVPPEHWRLVGSVVVEDRPAAAYHLRTRTISLPRQVHGYHLAHEVGHAWAFSDDRAVQRAWTRQFWPDHTPSGQLLDYPASVWLRGNWRLAAAEDLAESYAYLVCGWWVEPERAVWLVEHAPSLRAGGCSA